MAVPVLSFNSRHQQKCSQSFSSLIIPRTLPAQLLPPVETSEYTRSSTKRIGVPGASRSPARRPSPTRSTVNDAHYGTPTACQIRRLEPMSHKRSESDDSVA